MGLLNDLKIKCAKSRDKEYLLADGEGLYLPVRPSGKAWPSDIGTVLKRSS